MAFILMLAQLFAALAAGAYFFTQLFPRERRPREDARMDARLARMRKISLAPPLTERVRPAKACQIIGQRDALRALRAALGGENPQHVLLYGPPGVGKTCAARLIFEEARGAAGGAFQKDAPFVELDAATLRCDERGIADALLGSVHDPIYQGAGALGARGVPQPKEGAVTRAHGGVLFLDEIGEMHPAQMNRLLKVLEERRVRLESAYYTPGDPAVPAYVRDIFENGLPADFRLIAATTRAPRELPPALRSRCVEVRFRALGAGELARVAREGIRRAGARADEAAIQAIGESAASGRDAVSLAQLALGAARARGKGAIAREDVRWALECAGFVPREARALPANDAPRPGRVYALAVTACGAGAVVPVEAAVCPGRGRLTVCGAALSETCALEGGRSVSRAGTALCAAENARMYLRTLGYMLDQTDIVINFPGAHLADGPSAGAAMAAAIASCADARPVRADVALTGEISLTGRLLPVGGMPQKLEAARRAGLAMVLVPAPAPAHTGGLRALPAETFPQAYALLTRPARPLAKEA